MHRLKVRHKERRLIACSQDRSCHHNVIIKNKQSKRTRGVQQGQSLQILRLQGGKVLKSEFTSGSPSQNKISVVRIQNTFAPWSFSLVHKTLFKSSVSDYRLLLEFLESWSTQQGGDGIKCASDKFSRIFLDRLLRKYLDCHFRTPSRSPDPFLRADRLFGRSAVFGRLYGIRSVGWWGQSFCFFLRCSFSQLLRFS